MADDLCEEKAGLKQLAYENVVGFKKDEDVTVPHSTTGSLSSLVTKPEITLLQVYSRCDAQKSLSIWREGQISWETGML